jgi:biopolymer transport protein ExbD
MAAPGHGGWTEQEPLADINIVPLVDVLLVLLVIFMITAPIIAPSLQVQLPRVALDPGTNPNQTITITIDREDRLAINDRVLGPLRDDATFRRFESEIATWRASYPNAPAFLRADRLVKYGTVVQVMARLNRMGVVDVGLMIEQESN